jgi:hypothetical protein
MGQVPWHSPACTAFDTVPLTPLWRSVDRAVGARTVATMLPVGVLLLVVVANVVASVTLWRRGARQRSGPARDVSRQVGARYETDIRPVPRWYIPHSSDRYGMVAAPGSPARPKRRLSRAEQRAWRALVRSLDGDVCRVRGEEAAALNASFAGSRVRSIDLVDADTAAIRPSPQVTRPAKVEVVTDTGSLCLSVPRYTDVLLLLRSLRDGSGSITEVLTGPDQRCWWVRFYVKGLTIGVPVVDVLRR